MMTPSSKVYCTTKGGIKEEKQYFMPGVDSKIGMQFGHHQPAEVHTGILTFLT